MLRFFNGIKDYFLGENLDYNVGGNPYEDPDFIQYWQALVNQQRDIVHPIRNEREEANEINKKFINLRECSINEFKKDIDDARIRLLSPFYSDLEDLDTNTCFLNTHIMNRWFDYLAYKYQEVGVTNIHSYWGNEYLNNLDKGCLQLDMQRLKNARIIFWPLTNGNHWYGLVIEQGNMGIQISTFDGNNFLQDQEYIFSIGQKLVKSLHGTDHANRAIKKKWYVPQQDNNYDCGVVICYGAERICNGYSPSFEADTDFGAYTGFRLMIAEVLSSFTVDQFMNGFIPQGQKNKNTLSCSRASLMPVINQTGNSHNQNNQKRIKAF